MAYTVPHAEIVQQFVAAPIFANNPLSAFIIGPNYQTLRYTDASEKSWTYIGDYTGSQFALTAYPWVSSNPGSTVDVSNSYAGLTPYLENAFVEYFRGQGVHSDGTSGVSPGDGVPFVVKGSYTSTDDYAAAVAVTSGVYYTNKVRSLAHDGTGLSFAPGDNPHTGGTYYRSGYFSARDVQVGDWVAVTGLSGAATLITVFAQITSVDAEGDNGKVNTLVTAQRIFDVAGGTSTTLIAPGSSAHISIALYLRKTYQLPVSWLLTTTSATQVGLNASVTVTEPGLVDGSSVPVALSVGLPPAGATAYVASRLYVSYRVLRTDNAVSIKSLDDPALVEATLGAVAPENPLAEGVYDALLNASGTSVYYMAVPSDDLTGYNVVLEQAKRSNNLYGLVPLTFDTAVQDAVVAHVLAMSKPAAAKWRKAWICSQPVTFGLLPGYDRAAVGVNWTIGTSGADPELGTTGVFATIAASNSQDPALVTSGVRAGDTLRVFADGTTTTTYADYVIAAVRSQDEIVTTTAILNSGTRAIQILRTYSNEEQVAALGGASKANPRVNSVFPWVAKTAGVDKAGYFVAAALAGLRAGSLPHAPLTNVQLLGFDDFTTTLVDFTPDQLDTLASYGYWIVTQDVAGGTPYVRHQLTSDGYQFVGEDPKFSEDSLSTNVDSISYGLQRALRPFIGRYNVNPGTLALVSAAVNGQLHYQMLASGNSSAGPQLLGYNVDSLGVDPLFKDRIAGQITLNLPYPLNQVTITLVVP